MRRFCCQMLALFALEPGIEIINCVAVFSPAGSNKIGRRKNGGRSRRRSRGRWRGGGRWRLCDAGE